MAEQLNRGSHVKPSRPPYSNGRKAEEPEDTEHIYHITHSCGHQAWWTDDVAAVLTSAFPCPWCGGESGWATTHGKLVHLADLYGRALAYDFAYRGRVYVYPRVEHGREGGPRRAIIHHQRNDVCCRGKLVSLG